MSVAVSIVIVCMDNLKNLYPCLNSIRKYTTVSYETFVVAYLFTPENLAKAKADFPWVNFVESNEIRGFSENNNLALRQANGKYCFVVNDDTEMKMPVIDELVKTIESLSDNVAIVSPVLTYSDGRVQVCGRPYEDWKTVIRNHLHLGNKKNIRKYCGRQGVFQTYNIIGAAFLIKTEIFRTFGWFDERYFFCPEDIALSDTLNKAGYQCFVDADVFIIHYEGMSSKSLSLTQTATRPAQVKGGVIFFSQGKKSLYVLMALWHWLHSFAQFIVHRTKGSFQKKPNANYILSIGDWNICKSVLTRNSPKEIFTKYFVQINPKMKEGKK